MKSTTQIYVHENRAPVVFSDFITSSKIKSVEFYEKVTKSEYIKTGDKVESFESRSNKSLIVNDFKRNDTKSSVIDVKFERSSSSRNTNSNDSFTVNETVKYDPVVRTTRTVSPFLTATEINERIRNLFLDSFLCLNRKESILETVDELSKKVFESWNDFDTIEVRMPNGCHITFDWNNFRFEDSILKPPTSPIEWVTTRKTVTFK